MAMRDEAGCVSGAVSLPKYFSVSAKRQLSRSARVARQPIMIVRAIFGEWRLLAQSRHSWFGTNWRWKVAAVVTATHLQHDDLNLLILLSRKRIPKP
jgi:hypothetical protein